MKSLLIVLLLAGVCSAQSAFTVPLPAGNMMIPDDFNPQTDGGFG